MKWVYSEEKDPMTDEVHPFLAVRGTFKSKPKLSQDRPLLIVSCDGQKPRRISIGMGVILNDPEPMMRLDSEPATAQHWFTPNHLAANYYKDEQIANLRGSERMTRVLSSSPAVGADGFVKSLLGHSTFLVRAGTADPNDFVTVSFDISDLEKQLEAHHCETML